MHKHSFISSDKGSHNKITSSREYLNDQLKNNKKTQKKGTVSVEN